MRICLISGEYPPMQGGVGDYTAHIAKHLAAQGMAVAVATAAGARTGLGDEQGNPQVWRHVRRWGYGAMRQVRRDALRWGADVVHVQYQAAAFAMHPAANLTCLLLRGAARMPRIVVTFHDLKVPYLFPKAGALRRLAVLLLATTADACIVTNAEDADALRKHRLGRCALSSVIPIGSNIPVVREAPYDREAWRQRLGVERDDLLLAYFGFLNKNKGVDLLFDAVAELVRRGRRVRLVMIGGTAGDSDPTNRAYERRIRAVADAPSLRGNVLWTGFVNATAASAHLLASDICVLPFREGASFRHGTLVAAIEHGLPIVSATAAGFQGKEVGRVDGLRPLADGENALLVPAGEVGALVQAIERLCQSPELLAALRAGAAKLAPQFSWPAIAAQTIEVYRQVLGT